MRPLKWCTFVQTWKYIRRPRKCNISAFVRMRGRFLQLCCLRLPAYPYCIKITYLRPRASLLNFANNLIAFAAKRKNPPIKYAYVLVYVVCSPCSGCVSFKIRAVGWGIMLTRLLRNNRRQSEIIKRLFPEFRRVAGAPCVLVQYSHFILTAVFVTYVQS